MDTYLMEEIISVFWILGAIAIFATVIGICAAAVGYLYTLFHGWKRGQSHDHPQWPI